mmetsp:Transcript_15171/g.47025  ORF Transcript_15171/g.47025 Transcript_15171/m.47025 type:complete len:363 (-) Transcript_15171:17-1105(-)
MDGDDGRPRSAFERMIGRRTTPRAGQAAASPAHVDPTQLGSPPGAGRAGPSPRQGSGGFRRAGGASGGFAFPSAPVGTHHSAFDDDDGTSYASPQSPRRVGRASPRSRGGGASGRRRGGGGGDSDFAPGGAWDFGEDDDLELQPSSWAEAAVEEIYGCDPSAAPYVATPGAGPSAGPRSRAGSRSSRGGADSPFDADDDGFALPSPRMRRGSNTGAAGGGGGGKTRTRCRGLGGTEPLGDPSRQRTAFSAPPGGLASSGGGSAFQRGHTPSSGGGTKNKRLQRKATMSLPTRRRSELPPRRARGDTSDDSDGEYDAAVYFVAPSPAAGPARAPAPIPGQFVLPLQAEVEDSTELLFMQFELC